MQTAVKELFQYCVDTTVYNQSVHGGHTKIVPMVGTAEELTEKNLPNSASSNNQSLYSNITTFIFEDVEKNHSVRH
jgi:hypothetical protein